MKIRQENLVDYMSRKPYKFSECNTINVRSIAGLNSLPIYTSQRLWPTAKSVNCLADDFEVEPMHKIFIFQFSGRHYVVDTQGYNYMRYVARLQLT